MPSVGDVEQRVWILCEVARLQTQAGLDEGSERRSNWLFGRLKSRKAITGDSMSLPPWRGPGRSGRRSRSPARSRFDQSRASLFANRRSQARAGDIAGALQTASLIKVNDLKGDALVRLPLLWRTTGIFRAP